MEDKKVQFTVPETDTHKIESDFAPPGYDPVVRFTVRSPGIYEYTDQDGNQVKNRHQVGDVILIRLKGCNDQGCNKEKGCNNLARGDGLEPSST